jgi:hypothetical protein
MLPGLKVGEYGWLCSVSKWDGKSLSRIMFGLRICPMIG